jgi:glycosyltransferase involved in cell wall biosynthesis
MLNVLPTVVVSTYQDPIRLKGTLESLLKQSLQPCEIIVAEDDEDPVTKRCVEEFRSVSPIPVKHVTQRHDGFRKSRILNESVRISRSEYLVFIDGDCVAPKKFLQDHMNLAEKGYFIQGRRSYIKESHVMKFLSGEASIPRLMLSGKMHGVLKGIRLFKPVVKVDQEDRGVYGCNWSFSKSDFEKVNGYDEDFVGWGREDSDLASRLYHLGNRRKFVYGRAFVYHLNHPSRSRHRLDENAEIWERTKAERKVACQNGLVKSVNRH